MASLHQAIADNVPEDVFVRTILTASGPNYENPPAGFDMPQGMQYNKMFPGHRIGMRKPRLRSRSRPRPAAGQRSPERAPVPPGPRGAYQKQPRRQRRSRDHTRPHRQIVVGSPSLVAAIAWWVLCAWTLISYHLTASTGFSISYLISLDAGIAFARQA